jgi:hypothetical protein
LYAHKNEFKYQILSFIFIFSYYYYYYYYYYYRGRDNYGQDSWGSIPGRGNIFLSSTESRPALGPTQPPIQFVPEANSHRVKQPGREADRSQSSSDEDMNGGATPPLPICLQAQGELYFFIALDGTFKFSDYFV